MSNNFDTVCVKFESYFGMASDKLSSDESVPVWSAQVHTKLDKHTPAELTQVTMTYLEVGDL